MTKYYNISIPESAMHALKEELGAIKRKYGFRIAQEFNIAIERAYEEER